MLTNPTPWRTADTAYQSHHGTLQILELEYEDEGPEDD